MVRFLMLIRNGFNKYKAAFLSAFVVLIALLYFAPYAIFDTGGNGVWGLFTNWLSFPDMLQYVESGEVSMFDVVFYRIFPLALFVIAIVGACLAYKTNFLLTCSLPFSICNSHPDTKPAFFGLCSVLARLRCDLYPVRLFAYCCNNHIITCPVLAFESP